MICIVFVGPHKKLYGINQCEQRNDANANDNYIIPITFGVAAMGNALQKFWFITFANRAGKGCKFCNNEN